MGDIVLKSLRVGTEGAFTTGAAFQPSSSISVYGAGGAAVPATRRMAVEDATEFGYQELTFESPEEARGTYAGSYQHLVQMRAVKGKFAALMYPDDLVWWLRAAVSGSPTVTTLPSAPQALLAATAIAASMSLTSQPNAQADAAIAKLLAVTLSNAAADTTAVSATITGTDVNNNPLSEVLNFSAGTTTPSKVGGGAGALTVTLYTVNYFKTVTAGGIVTSAQPVGDQLAVGGINAFLWKFTPDMASSTLVSLSGEYFDGSTFWSLPGLLVPKFDFDVTIGKTAVIKGDCLGRDMINPLTPANLTDSVLSPASSFGARYYSDPIGSVPGTTQVSARLIAMTAGIENGILLGKAADGTPNPTFVARKRYKTKAEITLLFNNGTVGSEDPADFAAFQTNYLSRVVMLSLPSVNYLPCGQLTGATLAASGWPTQLADTSGTPRGGLSGVTLAHAGKFLAAAPVSAEGRLAVKLTHDGEVDLVGMGFMYTVQLVNRISPNAV